VRRNEDDADDAPPPHVCCRVRGAVYLIDVFLSFSRSPSLSPPLLPSQVRYAPVSGEFLVTASFDRSVKCWSARNYSLLRTLAGHEEKVMGLGISLDEKRVVTCGFDRTWKLWGNMLDF
jgi:WD40 repeat protein